MFSVKSLKQFAKSLPKTAKHPKMAKKNAAKKKIAKKEDPMETADKKRKHLLILLL